MIKFKNNILIKNIIILLSSGIVVKIIGMISKIIYTRIAGVNIVSLYALLTPTFMLIITITQFSFPISISKISAEEKIDNKMLLNTAYKLGLIIDIILIILIILSSNLVANLLHNKFLSPAIKSTCIIIPLITITSIQRGILHGKEDMFLPSITNIIEEIIKIFLIIIFLPLAISISNITAVVSIILFNVIMELSTILILNQKIKIYKNNKRLFNKENVNINIYKEILKISIPTTMIRLISSFAYFLEPIILSNVLINTGYSINYITLEYGIINSYIIPLLSFPNFFSIAIASALLPNITKLYINKNYDEFNKKIFKLLIISMIIGIFCLLFILIFPKLILILIFNTTLGINYIYLLGPVFILIYIQPTLSITLQAINKTNILFIISTISVIIKYTILVFLGKLNYGINSLIFSIIAGIIIVNLLLFAYVAVNINKRT